MITELIFKVSEDKEIKAPVLAVDYNNIEETAQLLASRKVEVVISTIHIMEETASIGQINLIKAASQSGTVKRFIVSEWGAIHTEECVCSQNLGVRYLSNASIGLLCINFEKML
jgi:hypothetical protein